RARRRGARRPRTPGTALPGFWPEEGRGNRAGSGAGGATRDADGSDHDDPGAARGAVVEVDDVLVEHAEAARRGRPADRLRLVGAVDAVARIAAAEVDVERARAERIVEAAGHAAAP